MLYWIHRAEAWLISFLMALLTGLVCAEALFRLFKITGAWLEQSIIWTASWFVLFGMSYGVRVGSHIGLTVLTDKITNLKIKKIVSLMALSICLIYCGIFIYSSWLYIQTQMNIGFDIPDLYLAEKALFGYPKEDLFIKQWIPYCGLLVGFGLLFIRFAVVFFSVLFNKSKGLKFSDEAKDSIEAFVTEKQS